MIFKVLYQETLLDIPVREKTKVIYMEADSGRTVRRKLEDRRYNIELIQELSGNHLEYEKKSDFFVLTEI